MPLRPSDRMPPARFADSVASMLRRARERRVGVTSIDTARRDRRARKAGTRDGIRALEDKVLDLHERDR